MYIVLGEYLRIFAPYRYLLPNLYCLWQISQIQTCLCVVVGPGLVSTSPAFMRSIDRHTAGPHGRLAQNTDIGPPFLTSSSSIS